MFRRKNTGNRSGRNRSLRRRRLWLPRLAPGVRRAVTALLWLAVIGLLAAGAVRLTGGGALTGLREQVRHLQLGKVVEALKPAERTAKAEKAPQPAERQESETVAEQREETALTPAIVDSCTFRVPTIVLLAPRKGCAPPQADPMGLVRFDNVSTQWQQPSDTTLLVRLFRQAGYTVQLAGSLTEMKAPDGGHHFIVVTPDTADTALSTALAEQIAPLNAMLVGAPDGGLWLWGSRRYRDSHPYGWTVINDSRHRDIGAPDALFHFLLYLGGIASPSFDYERCIIRQP